MVKLEYIYKPIEINGVAHVAHYGWETGDGAVRVASWKTEEDYLSEQFRSATFLYTPSNNSNRSMGALWLLTKDNKSPLYNGELREGVTTSGPSLDEVKATAWEQIKAARNRAETSSTFVALGSVFQSDPVRISGAVTGAQIALQAGLPFSLTWTLEDNSTRTLSATEMIQVGLAQLAHVDGLHQVARKARQNLQAASSLAEVDAVLKETMAAL